MGPCMCGDPYCPSCGVYSRCPACGAYNDGESECKDPAECGRICQAIDDQMVADLKECDAAERLLPSPAMDEGSTVAWFDPD